MKRKVIGILVLALIGIQFIPVEMPANAEVNSNDLFAVEQAPEEVKVIVKNVCYDCHSKQVKYPWYSKVAPVSWWLYDHIEEGTEHLNFSEWDQYSADKKAHKMEEAYEEVEEGEMPLFSYKIAHAEGRLSETEIASIVDWFKSIESKYHH